MGSAAQLSGGDSEEIKLVFDNWAHWPLPFKAPLTVFWTCFKTKRYFHAQPARSETLFKTFFWFSTLNIVFVSTIPGE